MVRVTIKINKPMKMYKILVSRGKWNVFLLTNHQYSANDMNSPAFSQWYELHGWLVSIYQTEIDKIPNQCAYISCYLLVVSIHMGNIYIYIICVCVCVCVYIIVASFVFTVSWIFSWIMKWVKYTISYSCVRPWFILNNNSLY